MPLTLTYDNVLSRVRISATDLSVLNTNPYFETDAFGWSTFGGTGVRSTAQAHQGAASLLVTPGGVAADVEATTASVPVAAGRSVRISAWVRCAVARDVHLLAVWSDEVTETGNMGTTVTLAANTWTLISQTGTAPAGTVQARLAVAMHSTPPAGHTLHIDEAIIEYAAATVTAVVERSTDGTRWTTVRGGAGMKVVGNAVSLDDYEFGADVANTYRVTAYSAPGLPADITEDFEDATLAVTITGGWARASGDAHDGAWALRSGAIGNNGTTDAVVTVPAGAKTMRFWYRVSSESGYDFFRFLLGGAEQLKVSGGGLWTQSPTFDVSSVATATFRYTKDVSLSGGMDAAWVDDIVFSGAPTAVTNTLTASVVPVLGGVWIKSIAQPFLNRMVTILDFSDVGRPARGGVFDVVGRSFPVAVSDVRGSRRWTLEVLTETPAEAADFDLVLASGDPLYIHVPADCPVPGGYVAVGDTNGRRTARYSQRRAFTLPCVEIAAPGPDVLGATLNWQTVLSRYSTWADLLAVHPTWAHLLDTVGSPQDVIVL